MNTHGSAIDDLLQLSHASLHEVISWLSARGMLVVAAAGNDGLSAAVRPEERLPAHYDMDNSPPSVIGVAAVTNSVTAADFSNRGDRGVAVLGGNATDSGPTDPPAVTRNSNGDFDAVVGIYSNPVFPFADDPPSPQQQNQTGWAFWSGTSFATPIVSAIATLLWQQNPGWNATKIIQEIKALQKTQVGTLGTDAIEATQLPAGTLGIHP